MQWVPMLPARAPPHPHTSHWRAPLAVPSSHELSAHEPSDEGTGEEGGLEDPVDLDDERLAHLMRRAYPQADIGSVARVRLANRHAFDDNTDL